MEFAKPTRLSTKAADSAHIKVRVFRIGVGTKHIPPKMSHVDFRFKELIIDLLKHWGVVHFRVGRLVYISLLYHLVKPW